MTGALAAPRSHAATAAGDAAPRGALRIEMVLPSLDVGGMETMVIGLARALAARGHTVGVTCVQSAGALAGAARAADLRVSVVHAPGLRTLVHAGDLVAHFGRLRPDVVHTHNGVWEKAARAARMAGVRSIGTTLHGLLDREGLKARVVKRWAARHTDWAAAVSDPLEIYLQRDLGMSADRVCRVMNGIDTERFAPGPDHGRLRARLGVPDGAPLLGIVARLAPLKGHLRLLEAMAALPPMPEPAHLAIIGDGPMRAAIEERRRSLGLESRVHLTGSLAGMPDAYRALDVFVLPSLAEGTSISVLEAMASGCCIVSTTVGGTPYLLDGGACGVLVAPDDAPALTAALAPLLADPSRRARLSGAARARAQAVFGHDTMVAQYERLYVGGASALRRS